MRWTVLTFLGLIVLAGQTGVRAQEPVVLKGRITCAKCELKISTRCATVIVVPQGERQQVYFFDTAAHRKYHRDTCGGTGKPGTVTGAVAQLPDGRLMVTVSQLTYDP